MKRINTLLLATVLVFSLVACGKNTDENKETITETSTETNVETNTETTGETAAESNAENEQAEKEIMALALNTDTVIASYEGVDAKVYKSKNSGLLQGHKYEFNLDPSTIEEGDVPVMDVNLGGVSGKEIGFPISKDVYSQLNGVVDYKVVDTRDAEKFAAENIENSINITDETTEAWRAEGAEKPELDGINKDTVIVIVGDDEMANKVVAKALYDLYRVNITLDAGNYDDLVK